jgi:putative DNA primase/helicase
MTTPYEPVDPTVRMLTSLSAPDDQPVDDNHGNGDMWLSDWSSEGTRQISDQELPPPDNPMAVARRLLPAWRHEGVSTLLHWRGQWMRWQGAHWIDVDDAAMRAELYPLTEHATFTVITVKEEIKTVPWAPTRVKIANLMEAAAAITHLSSVVDVPSWIDRGQGGQGSGWDDGQGSRATNAQVVRGGQGGQGSGTASRYEDTFVACRNGLLNLRTRQLLPPTPAFFNLVSTPCCYDDEAPEPKEWLKFLDAVLPSDAEGVALLQEWFGYVLSGRTDLQKMLLLVGARRSGKGTIGRVLTALVGKAHVASPTLSSMATNFGMSTLIGKSLAIIGDARVPRGGADTVVERLLSITGEDSLDVDRKNRDLWTGRLPARILILSNDLPAFADASGAITSRMVLLTFAQSFLGKEDTGLEGRLMAELPGILNWALAGLDHLDQRGKFLQPESSSTAAEILAESVSPFNAFLEEWCVVGPEHSVSKDALYAAWEAWCIDSKRDHPGTKEGLAKRLFSVNPGIRAVRGREGGRRVQTYTGIAIRTAMTSNPDHPDHPRQTSL